MDHEGIARIYEGFFKMLELPVAFKLLKTLLLKTIYKDLYLKKSSHTQI